MAFNIILDDKDFRLYIKALSKNVQMRSLILMAARNVAARSAGKRFRDGGESPYNWPALADSTIRQRIREGTWPGEGGSQPILRRFGKLREAILDTTGSKTGSLFNRLGPDAIEFGTDFVGADSLQKGDRSRNLPARPFHYWSGADVIKITKFAMSFMYGGKIGSKRPVFNVPV